MLWCYQGHIDEYTAKQCALVAADQIMSVLQNMAFMGKTSEYSLGYWQEVKREIEKIKT